MRNSLEEGVVKESLVECDRCTLKSNQNKRVVASHKI